MLKFLERMSGTHLASRLGRAMLATGLLLTLCLAPALAQQKTADLDDDDAEEVGDVYDREFNYGINFNTDGGLIGGGILKYAWEYKPGWYRRIMLEVVNLKHPHEYKVRGPVSAFIVDKTNYLFAVRPSFGGEYRLFRKAPEVGVQLNAVWGVGPTLGLIKPYYVLVQNPQDPSFVVSRPYTPDLAGYVVGVGGVTDGFDELNVVPGAHVRAGLSFESGRIRSSVFGLEAGFVLEAYTKPVTLLQASNTAVEGYNKPQFWNSLYLIIYYGSKR